MLFLVYPFYYPKNLNFCKSRFLGLKKMASHLRKMDSQFLTMNTNLTSPICRFL